MKFLIIFMIIWLVATIVIFYPQGNRRYVYLFERSLWNGWKNVIAHFDTIKYMGYYDNDNPYVENHSFIITIGDQKCRLIYWVFEDAVSVHDYIDPKEECLSDFDKYHCKMVKDLLCEKFDFMKLYK